MTDLARFPKVLSEEEIEAMLHGDRRQIDKLLLTQVNGLSAAFIEFKFKEFPDHASHEEALHNEIKGVLEELGSKEEVRERTAYVDTLIERAKVRTDMMRKVATSAWTWALILFLAFLGKSIWMSVIDTLSDIVKTQTGSKP